MRKTNPLRKILQGFYVPLPWVLFGLCPGPVGSQPLQAKTPAAAMSRSPEKPPTHPAAQAAPFLNALRQAGIAPQHAALVIYLPNEGRYLLRHHATRLQPAASNTKLLTSYVALRILGEQHRWRTHFWLVPHPITQGNPQWALWVRGSGDPSIRAQDIARIAHRLRAAGLKRFEGSIFLDSSHYEAAPNPPHWPKKRLWKHWAAPLSPFIVEQNIAKVRIVAPPLSPEWLKKVRLVKPADTNRHDVHTSAPQGAPRSSPALDAATNPVKGLKLPAKTTTDPSIRAAPLLVALPFVANVNLPTLRVKASFILGNKPPKLQVLQHWDALQGHIKIHGRMPFARFPMQLELAVYKPALHFGLLLRHFLQQAGVEGAQHAALRFGKPPAQGRKKHNLYTHHSRPLKQLLHLPLNLSSNVAAEAILRETALAYRPHISPKPQGAISAKEAKVAYASILKHLLQATPQQASLFDGSGLSPNNQTSAMMLIKVLRLAWQDTHLQKPFFGALPVLGVRGTLRWRRHLRAMRGRVMAKTGSLYATSNLSGLMLLPQGKPVLFSFLLHQAGKRSATLQTLQDNALGRIFSLLQTLPSAKNLPHRGPLTPRPPTHNPPIKTPLAKTPAQVTK